MDPQILQKTHDTLGKAIKRPVLTDKILQRPPFRFVYDCVRSVIDATGGAMRGLFTDQELAAPSIVDRDEKLAFLNKIISYLGQTTGQDLRVKSKNIIAGLEPEQTNEFLQILGTVARKSLGKDHGESRKHAGKKMHKADKSAREKSSDEIRGAADSQQTAVDQSQADISDQATANSPRSPRKHRMGGASHNASGRSEHSRRGKLEEATANKTSAAKSDSTTRLSQKTHNAEPSYPAGDKPDLIEAPVRASKISKAPSRPASGDRSRASINPASKEIANITGRAKSPAQPKTSDASGTQTSNRPSSRSDRHRINPSVKQSSHPSADLKSRSEIKEHLKDNASKHAEVKGHSKSSHHRQKAVEPSTRNGDIPFPTITGDSRDSAGSIIVESTAGEVYIDHESNSNAKDFTGSLPNDGETAKLHAKEINIIELDKDGKQTKVNAYESVTTVKTFRDTQNNQNVDNLSTRTAGATKDNLKLLESGLTPEEEIILNREKSNKSTAAEGHRSGQNELKMESSGQTNVRQRFSLPDPSDNKRQEKLNKETDIKLNRIETVPKQVLQVIQTPSKSGAESPRREKHLGGDTRFNLAVAPLENDGPDLKFHSPRKHVLQNKSIFTNSQKQVHSKIITEIKSAFETKKHASDADGTIDLHQAYPDEIELIPEENIQESSAEYEQRINVTECRRNVALARCSSRAGISTQSITDLPVITYMNQPKVITEKKKKKEESESDDEFLVGGHKTAPSTDLDFGRRFSGSSSEAGNEFHGSLVKKILNVKRGAEGKSKTDIDRSDQKDRHTFMRNQRANVAKEVEPLRMAVQLLTGEVIELVKSIQFVHEDVDSLNNECQTWRDEARENAGAILREMEDNAGRLQPLVEELEELEREIERQNDVNAGVKGKIFKNESRIKNLMVVDCNYR